MLGQDSFGSFNMKPMKITISNELHKDQSTLQPAKMMSGFSSFANWPEFKSSVMFPSNKSEYTQSNDKLVKLEEENMILEQKIVSLTEENANITKQWEFERDFMKDQIFNHKQTIANLTNIINEHLQKELNNRDNLINSMNRLKEDSVATVKSQTMSKVSDYNETGSLNRSTNSSNRVSKPSRNNSNGSGIDENRGAKASKIFADIVKHQQSQVHNQKQTPLTINKKVLLKHTEDIRSQSLPYNLDKITVHSLEDLTSFANLNGPMKPDFMIDEEINNASIQNGVHISDVENGSNLGSVKPVSIDEKISIPTNQLINNALESPNPSMLMNESTQNKITTSHNEQDIPVYDFVKCPKKVSDLWKEFTISTPDKPSILKMNEMYGSAWRKLSPALDKQYSRRHMVYRAIKFGMEHKGFTVDQCIDILEQTRIKYYDSVSGEEVDFKNVSEKDLENGKFHQKQKSIGWLTNYANIPSILKG
ncbi:uncharacterized protein HGUI_00509 [Hanseniaspora guilliermondii]|uniref:Transcription activator GCR1-like domain-containing protein n=1 Tax=Hanseniaspora guilliermondii TaxID=56406 RepID=A0A1L0CHR8_9ASCO|nr:uncharacterized protein HGUI_00509 [Hanseniaspora guilliermondii]